MAIGNKQGTTYYSECNRMASVVNPIIDNDVHMRYSGFFNEINTERNFDVFGYGLKKTRANKGVIICDNAEKLFGQDKGYVGITLSFKEDIENGIYKGIKPPYSNEYLLWGINVGKLDVSYPTIYAKLTTSGIEFTVWTQYSKFTIINDSFDAAANSFSFFEFLWDNSKLDDFNLDDVDATMAIRINGEDTVIGNAPVGQINLSGLNFCALDTISNYYNLECILGKLVIGNEVPISVAKEWESSSTSSESGVENSSSSTSSESIGGETPYTYEYVDLTLNTMTVDPTVVLALYVNLDVSGGDLQIVSSQRRFKHIWLPNSFGSRTISKLDVSASNAPVEKGRYALAPIGSNPSRTIVVPPGDCWVANRSHGTVVKVGLTDVGSCRNNCQNTSSGTNVLNFGDDDAVLLYFDVSSETVKLPSSTGYPSNAIGIRGLTDDVDGNIWINGGLNNGIWSKSGTWFKINGDGGLNGNGSVTKYANMSDLSSYGAVCSYSNNYIWSNRYNGNTFFGLDYFSADDPSIKGKFEEISTYGISYSRGNVFVGDWFSSVGTNIKRVLRIDAQAAEDPDNLPLYVTTFTFTNCPHNPRTFTVLTNDDSGVDANRTEDLYISFYPTIAGQKGVLYCIKNHKQYAVGVSVSIDFSAASTSFFKKYSSSFTQTAGVGVMYDVSDNPFVWLLNQDGVNVEALDPVLESFITFTPNSKKYFPVGENAHYNYTNFTGTVDEATVYPIIGTATYTLDSGSIAAQWNKICLTLTTPPGSSLTIKVSSSNNSSSFQPGTQITNCSDISSLNIIGRYLQLVLTFNRDSQVDPTPTVENITVELTK